MIINWKQKEYKYTIFRKFINKVLLNCLNNLDLSAIKLITFLSETDFKIFWFISHQHEAGQMLLYYSGTEEIFDKTQL